MARTYRPQLLVVTRNRVRAHHLLAEYFVDWETVFSSPMALSWRAGLDPILVLIEHRDEGASLAAGTAEEIRRRYPVARMVALLARCERSQVLAVA